MIDITNMHTHTDWVRFGHVNACGVDWSDLFTFNYVEDAMRKTKIAAYWLAQLMRTIDAAGIRYERTSVAGHSLGAHVAGFAGKHVKAWSGGRRLSTIFGKRDGRSPSFGTALHYRFTRAQASIRPVRCSRSRCYRHPTKCCSPTTPISCRLCTRPRSRWASV